ncbi:recombinase family protein [Rhodobacterales bacterium LSUCC0031]|nr:recombinase family protein [Rhodobacterales bacterium LSUCC0031]
MATGAVISYLRVSTARQGKSGLGLEAQRKAVADYLNGGNWQLLAEMIEVESGKKSDRPVLQEAIDLSRATGATLVVAKIDRLTRDAAFLLSLRDAGIDFVAADMPDANRLTVGIMALVAEQEREAISRRTKDALAAAKARGVQLGAYRDGQFVGRVGTAEDAQKASVARAAKYEAAARTKLPLLQRVDPLGSLSLRQIAERFNAMGVPTVSGKGSWSANSVKRLKAISP